MSAELPRHARAIVVGGGIAGTSAAYHLAGEGWTDVLLLEQNALGAGTTWHAAGAVGRLRVTGSLARMNDRSARLYSQIEAETGVPVGYQRVGGLALAQQPERMAQLRRSASMAAHFGVDVQIISRDEAKELWPLAQLDDVIGAAWLPDDGRAEPGQLPRAIAEGARRRGATVREGVRVLEVLHDGRRVSGVRTDRGDVTADVVVLACGMWTRQLAGGCGVSVPLHPVEHHYLLSNTTGGDLDAAPVTRDLDGSIYFRGEKDTILIGAFQAESKPWLVDEVPADFAFSLLEPDWEHFAAPLEEAYARLPILREIGFAKFVNGPESFTPDGNLLMGETPELERLYVLAGFNSSGLAFGGGAGEALAQWIVGGEQPFDLWPVDIRRFGPWHANRAFLRARTRRDARHALPAGGSEPRVRARPRPAPVAAARPSGRARRLVRAEDGRGAAELVRRPRAAAGGRVRLRPAELVREPPARARGHARGGRGVRPELVRQAAGQRPRRPRVAAAPVRERRRRRD